MTFMKSDFQRQVIPNPSLILLHINSTFSRIIILFNFQGIATLLINLMIFNYGGVLASANIMVSRLLEGEEGTYFNLKLNESEVSWIGIGSF